MENWAFIELLVMLSAFPVLCEEDPFRTHYSILDSTMFVMSREDATCRIWRFYDLFSMSDLDELFGNSACTSYDVDVDLSDSVSPDIQELTQLKVYNSPIYCWAYLSLKHTEI
ncbi:hypothetical protein RF11_08066 [Thelohanellus kitauei]|uniref:Uncharacterized protein n=1 Tax=Thelohanellus kitauei TaxID=669202 RepID=A0A0C2IDZ6_THEKT|nr:hypothetical protein RF11_08066 [Thelohanellus kitauei]